MGSCGLGRTFGVQPLSTLGVVGFAVLGFPQIWGGGGGGVAGLGLVFVFFRSLGLCRLRVGGGGFRATWSHVFQYGSVV